LRHVGCLLERIAQSWSIACMTLRRHEARYRAYGEADTFGLVAGQFAVINAINDSR